MLHRLPTNLPWCLALAILAGTACAGSEASLPEPEPPAAQAISFLGDSLVTLPLTDSTRARYERQLAEAKSAYDNAPTDPDSIIWYGRRLGYLGKFRESIEVYTRGLAMHPDNPWMLRHRGHRFISVRELDQAIDDLAHAAALVGGQPDQVEPDGQPNAMSQPIGTLHSNVAYHLALAWYLKGEYERAVEIYRRELAAAQNDDRRVSTGHWLYMSLRRLGRDADAAALLAGFSRDMNVIENQTYHNLMLMYKGVLPPDSVLMVGPSGEMSVTDATAAYGVGNWHIYSGRRPQGEDIYRRIIAAGQWGAFGFIAAEADLAYGR
jgi:tetratricopeptide (TPR) repeat protein